MSKKRRTYTAQFKFETIVETLRGEKSNAQICRERNITESLLYEPIQNRGQARRPSPH